MDRVNRAVNLHVYNALQLTSPSVVASNPAENLSVPDTRDTKRILSADNIAELLSARLTEQADDSALVYLCACYKRIAATEASTSPDVKTELAK